MDPSDRTHIHGDTKMYKANFFAQTEKNIQTITSNSNQSLKKEIIIPASNSQQKKMNNILL